MTSEGGGGVYLCPPLTCLTCAGNAGEEGEDDSADTFGFGEGAFHTFSSFKKRADGFKDKWFGSWDRTVPPTPLALPPWRQPRGRLMDSSVNFDTYASRIGWHL